jgi:hypothetical protein
MRGEGYDLGSALTFVVLFNLGGIVGMRSQAGPPTGSAPRGSRRSGSR